MPRLVVTLRFAAAMTGEESWLKLCNTWLAASLKKLKHHKGDERANYWEEKACRPYGPSSRSRPDFQNFDHVT